MENLMNFKKIFPGFGAKIEIPDFFCNCLKNTFIVICNGISLQGEVLLKCTDPECAEEFTVKQDVNYALLTK